MDLRRAHYASLLNLANIEEEALMCGRAAEWPPAEGHQVHDAASRLQAFTSHRFSSSSPPTTASRSSHCSRISGVLPTPILKIVLER
jgi:hypothetical protein